MTATRPLAVVASQAARPLRHWPDAALERASRMLDNAWRDWCARWQLTGAEVATWNACDDAAAADSLGRAWTTGCSSWLSTGTDDAGATLAKLLFGHDSPTDAPIAQALAADALSDLLTALEQASARTDTTVSRMDDGPPEAELRRWSGALRVRLVALRDDHPVSWHLHCSEPLAAVLCGGVQPSSGASRAPLAQVADAIGARPLAFKVMLDETTLTLGTLQSLHVGDVLPLAHRLDQPLRVVPTDATRDAPSFCAAFLGSRGDHRAVELVPATPTSASIES